MTRFSNKKTALITGVSGYLGSHVAKTLKNAGWYVLGIDIKHNINPYIDQFYLFNVLNIDAISQIFENNKIDVVFHFAGVIDVHESTQVPAIYYHTNTSGTITLLNAMIFHGVNNIIYSSTAGLYKSQNKELFEDDELCPQNNPYAGSKYASELAISQSGLNHVIFRYFNLAGADPEGGFGENHQPETHLIPKIFQNLNKLKIYGDNYETQDGTCVRDFVHVSDVADAHLLAANYLLDAGESVTMNLGTGKGHSVKEIVNLVGKVTGEKVHAEVVGRRQGDPAYLVSNINLARLVLKFEPRHDIISILETAYKWHKSQS